MTEALAPFHPLIRQWFADTYPAATDVQRRSWPNIARGEHALLTAPTGSGKTLTAFLWSLNQFLVGEFECGRTQVLYVSPLKALNNDIRVNLLEPLGALRAMADTHDASFPDVRVQVRSGDTPASERQRMLRRPPEILITTPESLTLLLTTAKGRQALGNVRTVILDEIHALIESRRGVMLMSSIERLAMIAGEFQRIALSATINPLDTVAAYVGGFMPGGAPRTVVPIASAASKEIDFRVRFPPKARNAAGDGKHIWEPLVDSFKESISRNQATLFFTNSRRLAEKISHKINSDETTPIAYPHHGSLAREIRTEVEARLKAGELRAIVATSSLEMGIDIGHLDEVVLIQSPGSISSAMQRIGRAGHQVGETSRGSLYPTHAKDFLEAATLARAISERAIEPLRPIENPLDVLAQIIISITATESWQVDELYQLVTLSYPYRTLAREQFDLVIEMLTGRYAGARVRDLAPRLRFDRIRGTLEATKGAVFAFYNSGGTIPDRGYYQLRHADTGQAIGELDEEFVWEAHIGQVLSFGSQRWQIQRITHNDVLVRVAKPGTSAPPFWRAEAINRSFHFSQRIGEFLERCDARLEAGQAAGLEQLLCSEHGFEASAAAELIEFLTRQREVTGASLPHRHHLLLEDVATGPGGYRGADAERQLVLHTHWGARLNRPLALALQALWRERYDTVPEMHADNDAVIIQSKHEADVQALLQDLTAAGLDALLRRELEGSGFFGARFRECAGRALLLTRRRFNQRVPLWMTRLNAKKLMSATKQFDDFPVMLETWRTCLADEFELDALKQVLDELAAGSITVTHVSTDAPSPFAAGLAWSQINRYMYADDTPERSDASALSEDLIRSAVHDEALRPRLDRAVIESFERKRQRLEPGYAPRSVEELADWLKERVLIIETEWYDLLGALDDGLDTSVDLQWLVREDRRWAVHTENAGHLLRELLMQPDTASAFPRLDDSRDAAQLIREVLSFYGPLRMDELEALLPCATAHITSTLAVLVDENSLVSGPLVCDDESLYYCDTENLESLLRFQRAARRPSLEALPARALPNFLARWQGFGESAGSAEIESALDRLRGYATSPDVWLDELLSARFPGISPRTLDDRVANGELRWVGCGRELVTFAATTETDLVRDLPDPSLSTAFRDPAARYDFFQLAEQFAEQRAESSLSDANDALWASVWAGELSADTLAPLQRGRACRYQLPAAATPSNRRVRARRGGLGGWPGAWYLLPYETQPPSALEELETAKERCRILLDRYGVLTRELANREGGVFAWKRLFRALRIMELGGEVTTGLFFEGLSGPQFATPAAVRLLSSPLPPAGFWLNAMDPAAPTGLGIDWDEPLALPQRRASNHLAFNLGRLIMVSERSGARLRIASDLTADDVQIITAWLAEQVRRVGRIRIEHINDAASAPSDILQQLRDALPADVQVEHDHRGGVEFTRAASAYMLNR
jgi:ATP-dependent Lhr-like helicase